MAAPAAPGSARGQGRSAPSVDGTTSPAFGDDIELEREPVATWLPAPSASLSSADVPAEAAACDSTASAALRSAGAPVSLRLPLDLASLDALPGFGTVFDEGFPEPAEARTSRGGSAGGPAAFSPSPRSGEDEGLAGPSPSFGRAGPSARSSAASLARTAAAEASGADSIGPGGLRWPGTAPSDDRALAGELYDGVELSRGETPERSAELSRCDDSSWGELSRRDRPRRDPSHGSLPPPSASLSRLSVSSSVSRPSPRLPSPLPPAGCPSPRSASPGGDGDGRASGARGVREASAPRASCALFPPSARPLPGASPPPRYPPIRGSTLTSSPRVEAFEPALQGALSLAFPAPGDRDLILDSLAALAGSSAAAATAAARLAVATGGAAGGAEGGGGDAGGAGRASPGPASRAPSAASVHPSLLARDSTVPSMRRRSAAGERPDAVGALLGGPAPPAAGRPATQRHAHLLSSTSSRLGFGGGGGEDGEADDDDDRGRRWRRGAPASRGADGAGSSAASASSRSSVLAPPAAPAPEPAYLPVSAAAAAVSSELLAAAARRSRIERRAAALAARGKEAPPLFALALAARARLRAADAEIAAVLEETRAKGRREDEEEEEEREREARLSAPSAAADGPLPAAPAIEPVYASAGAGGPGSEGSYGLLRNDDPTSEGSYGRFPDGRPTPSVSSGRLGDGAGSLSGSRSSYSAPFGGAFGASPRPRLSPAPRDPEDDDARLWPTGRRRTGAPGARISRGPSPPAPPASPAVARALAPSSRVLRGARAALEAAAATRGARAALEGLEEATIAAAGPGSPREALERLVRLASAAGRGGAGGGPVATEARALLLAAVDPICKALFSLAAGESEDEDEEEGHEPDDEEEAGAVRGSDRSQDGRATPRIVGLGELLARPSSDEPGPDAARAPTPRERPPGPRARTLTATPKILAQALSDAAACGNAVRALRASGASGTARGAGGDADPSGPLSAGALWPGVPFGAPCASHDAYAPDAHLMSPQAFQASSPAPSPALSAAAERLASELSSAAAAGAPPSEAWALAAAGDPRVAPALRARAASTGERAQRAVDAYSSLRRAQRREGRLLARAAGAGAVSVELARRAALAAETARHLESIRSPVVKAGERAPLGSAERQTEIDAQHARARAQQLQQEAREGLRTCAEIARRAAGGLGAGAMAPASPAGAAAGPSPAPSAPLVRELFREDAGAAAEAEELQGALEEAEETSLGGGEGIAAAVGAGPSAQLEGAAASDGSLAPEAPLLPLPSPPPRPARPAVPSLRLPAHSAAGDPSSAAARAAAATSPLSSPAAPPGPVPLPTLLAAAVQLPLRLLRGAACRAAAGAALDDGRLLERCLGLGALALGDVPPGWAAALARAIEERQTKALRGAARGPGGDASAPRPRSPASPALSRGPSSTQAPGGGPVPAPPPALAPPASLLRAALFAALGPDAPPPPGGELVDGELVLPLCPPALDLRVDDRGAEALARRRDASAGSPLGSPARRALVPPPPPFPAIALLPSVDRTAGGGAEGKGADVFADRLLGATRRDGGSGDSRALSSSFPTLQDALGACLPADARAAAGEAAAARVRLAGARAALGEALAALRVAARARQREARNGIGPRRARTAAASAPRREAAAELRGSELRAAAREAAAGVGAPPSASGARGARASRVDEFGRVSAEGSASHPKSDAQRVVLSVRAGEGEARAPDPFVRGHPAPPQVLSRAAHAALWAAARALDAVATHLSLRALDPAWAKLLALCVAGSRETAARVSEAARPGGPVARLAALLQTGAGESEGQAGLAALRAAAAEAIREDRAVAREEEEGEEGARRPGDEGDGDEGEGARGGGPRGGTGSAGPSPPGRHAHFSASPGEPEGRTSAHAARGRSVGPPSAAPVPGSSWAIPRGWWWAPPPPGPEEARRAALLLQRHGDASGLGSPGAWGTGPGAFGPWGAGPAAAGPGAWPGSPAPGPGSPAPSPGAWLPGSPASPSPLFSPPSFEVGLESLEELRHAVRAALFSARAAAVWLDDPSGRAGEALAQLLSAARDAAAKARGAAEAEPHDQGRADAAAERACARLDRAAAELARVCATSAAAQGAHLAAESPQAGSLGRLAFALDPGGQFARARLGD